MFSQNLVFLSASERIAAALVHLVEPNVSADSTHDVRVTQWELGQHANITREWVMSTLCLFETEGLNHKEKDAVSVLDLDRLRH
jgi:fructose-bisphosphate aldolase class 1